MINPLFAYVGPETILPITSVLAAIAGFFLTMGKSSLGYLAGFFRRSPSGEQSEQTESAQSSVVRPAEA